MKRLLTETFKSLLQVPRFLYGLYYVSHLKRPIITVFGGLRIAQDSKYYKEAFELSRRLAQHGCSIMSGGGAGIMEASLCGAISIDKGNQVLGIGVNGVDEGFVTQCRARFITVGTFTDRKELLINYSAGFVLFPGGYGTLDELSDVLNLIKTDKLAKIPIILFGTEYWESLHLWLQDHPVKDGYISPEMHDLVKLTDSIDECLVLLGQATKS